MKEQEDRIREVLQISKVPSYKILTESICTARKAGIDVQAYFNYTTDDEGFVQSIMISVNDNVIIHKDKIKLNVGTKDIWSDQLEKWFRKILIEVLSNGYIHMYEATIASFG